MGGEDSLPAASDSPRRRYENSCRELSLGPNEAHRRSGMDRTIRPAVRDFHPR
jgi:hypothetical protein